MRKINIEDLDWVHRYICAAAINIYLNKNKVIPAGALGKYSIEEIQQCLAKMIWDRRIVEEQRNIASECLNKLMGKDDKKEEKKIKRRNKI